MFQPVSSDSIAAEVSYRQDRIRSDFGRFFPSRRHHDAEEDVGPRQRSTSPSTRVHPRAA